MNLNSATNFSSLHGNSIDAIEIATSNLTLRHNAADVATDMCDTRADEKSSSSSSSSSSTAHTMLPTLSWEDIRMGTLLGRGGFSTVHLVTLSTTSKEKCPSMSEKIEYALKRLNEDMSEEDSETSDYAAADLVYEAKILSQLPEHENIVRLHALSTNFWENPQHGFLILERLKDTLHDRLAGWRRNPKCRNKQQLRITQIAPSIASAMKFLHQNRIIYRDLKPENIGFDATGNVRILDFGLARVYEKGETRKLTGRTGSARYMAPEVARSQPYSFPADVHSYSILMWEVCTLQKAYANAVNVSRMLRQVAHGTVRPSLERIESPAIKTLLSACWNPDPSMRPTFEYIVKELKGEAKTC